MATTTDSSNPLSTYGYDQKTGQQLADSLGMSPQQLAAALATTQSMTPSGQMYSTEGALYTKSPTGQGNIPNPTISSAIQQLQFMKAAGMMGGNQQQAPASTSSSGAPFTDATNLAGRMGAAALGTNQIINPTPGQIPSGDQGKGGVAQVASPIVSSDIPSAPTGPWSTTPGIFAKAPNVAAASGGIPTPTRPSNAAASAAATPWATAPPAPGASAQQQPDWGAVANHQAMQDAGKGIYQHLTGRNPADASHADISAFHDVLQSHIGTIASQMGGAGGTPFGQAPPGAANYTAGVAPGVSATGATPGAALGVAPPQSPIKMAGGGFVPDENSAQTGGSMVANPLMTPYNGPGSPGAAPGGDMGIGGMPAATGATSGLGSMMRSPGAMNSAMMGGGSMGGGVSSSPGGGSMFTSGALRGQPLGDMGGGGQPPPWMSSGMGGGEPPSWQGGAMPQISSATANPFMKPYTDTSSPGMGGMPAVAGMQANPLMMQSGALRGQPLGDMGGGMSSSPGGPSMFTSGALRGPPLGGMGGDASAVAGMQSGGMQSMIAHPFMTPYAGPGSPGAGIGAPPAAPGAGSGEEQSAAADAASGGTHMGMGSGYVPPPKEMRSGGRVPGRGNQDTVPALLTPGEYVIPKQQAAQIFGGRAPVRMADGGFVWEDPNQRKKPAAEIPRGMGASATPAQQAAPSSAGTTQQQSSSGSDKDSDSDKASPTNHGYWSNMVQQAQAAKANRDFNAMGTGGYSGGGGQTVGDVADGAAIAGGGQTQSLGKLGGGVAGGVAAGADVASGLISGLQDAWDKYAKSIKNWQTIAPAFSQGGAPSYQTTQLQQNQDA